MILLKNVNVDTTSVEEKVDGGNRALVVRADNFGGGTVQIQVRSNNDSRFVLVTGGSFTADDTKILKSTKSGLTYRAVLSGSSGASNVFVELV